MLDYKFIKKPRIINSCTKNNGCLILFEDKKIKHSDCSDNLFALFHNNQNKNKNGKKQYELENY